MNFFDSLNVTFRRPRPRTQSESSIINGSGNVIPNTLECTTNSMPEMSDDDEGDQVKLLREEIQNLTKQLESAHKEIELLSVENSTLKSDNDKLIRKNNMYKKVATNSPSKSYQNTPRKTTHRNWKTKQTQTDIQECERSNNVENQFKTTKNKKGTKPPITDNLDRKETTNYVTTNTQTEIHPPRQLKKNKLCILSANKQNKVLSLVEKTFKEYNFCHYLTTKGATCDILQGINKKLTGYTKSDYCVILIGEHDFNIAKNYAELVLVIRKTLSEIRHTNVIICLPTYKYNINSNMYNWRVMNFNHSLCQDIYTHKYAYVLDSNACVGYDYNTFFKGSGQINNFGVNSIFVNLLNLINDIQCTKMYNNNTVNNNNLITLTSHNPTHVFKTEKQFFRD